jgi:hypothetical protein
VLGRLKTYEAECRTLDTRHEAKIVDPVVDAQPLKGDPVGGAQPLKGFLPICSWCKKIRDESGSWHEIEEYVVKQTGAHFTHGICPDCRDKIRAD